MKKSFLLFAIATLFTTVVAQPHLEQYYVGALYIGSAPKEYHQFQNVFMPLVAARVSMPLVSGKLQTRVMYDFKKTGAHFWWEKGQAVKFKAGFFPRPIAIIDRTDPVSDQGNFEAPSRAIIPGPAVGTLLTIKTWLNNELMLGAYKTSGGDSLEWNFGFQQEIGSAKFGVCGYYDSHTESTRERVRGAAINLTIGKISLMTFGGVDKVGIETSSLQVEFAPKSDRGFYLTMVQRAGMWELVQPGYFQLYEEKVGSFKVNYLVGVSYDYSETMPSTLSFDLQIWLN